MNEQNTCGCMDKDNEFCPVHAREGPNEMRNTREIHPDDDDRFLVSEDIFSLWMMSPEPRIPLDKFAEMYADIGEDMPTSPESPQSRRDSDPAFADEP